MKKILAFILLTSLFIVPFAFSSPNMVEGKWEITSDISIKGLPMKMPSVKNTQCLTKKSLIPQRKRHKKSTCTITKQTVSGNTVTWNIQCQTKKGTMTGSGTITYSGKTLSGSMDLHMTRGRRTMNMKHIMTGRYIGPCDK